MVTDALTGQRTYMFTNWPGVGQEEIIADNSLPGEWDTTCYKCVGHLDSGVVLITLAGEGVSLQEAVEVGNSVWASSDFTNAGVFSQFNTVAVLYTGVSREFISGYDALHRFGLYADSLIAKQGIKLISTRIRDWASVEEPEWKQLVMDFEVEARSDIALALWDRLNDELDGFLATLEGKLTPGVHDLISITVQWK